MKDIYKHIYKCETNNDLNGLKCTSEIKCFKKWMNLSCWWLHGTDFWLVAWRYECTFQIDNESQFPISEPPIQTCELPIQSQFNLERKSKNK